LLSKGLIEKGNELEFLSTKIKIEALNEIVMKEEE